MKVDNSLILIGLIGLFAFAYFGGYLERESVTGGAGGVALACPDDGTTDLNTKARNPLNASADFVPVTLYYSDMNWNLMGSATQLTTGNYKQTATTTKCGEQYRLFTKDDSNFVFAQKVTPVLTGSGVEVDMVVPRSTDVQFKAFDENGDNQTSGYVQDTTTTTAESLSSGGVLVYKILYQAKTSASQFGSDDPSAPTYICIDANPAKFSKSNGITLSGSGIFEKISTNLPKYCSDNGYESAYRISPVKSTDGTREMYVTIRADLGDPGASDDVKLMFVDSHAYLSSTGLVKVGTADDSASDIGETNRYITINLA